MSLAGLMGADHAFYYERARVLLPFRTGARTYLGETAFRYWCKPFSSPLATDQRRIPAADWNAGLEVVGFDAYPILAGADEIGVLPIDDIGSTFLARDVEASAICPNSTDMRDGLMRIMRVGLSDAGYLTSHYGLMCSTRRGAVVSITATRLLTDFGTVSN